MLTDLNFEAAIRRGLRSTVEHRLSKIGQRDLKSKRSEVQASMTTAGGDVERTSARRQGHPLQSRSDVLDIFEDVPAAVALALARELFLGGPLDFVELHQS